MAKSKNKSAVLYARFSPRPKKTDSKGRDKNELTLDAQFDICSDYCKFNKWDILDDFSDNYASGKEIIKRPGLERAMTMACKHKAILVCYSLSRLARSTRDAINLIDRLHRCKSDFCSVTERIDTTHPAGRLFFTMMAAWGQFERECISQRTSEAMLYYQDQGRKMGGVPPYGKAIDPNDTAMLIDEPREQKICELILYYTNKGMSARNICAELETLGKVSRSGKTRWHHRTILRIIQRLQ